MCKYNKKKLIYTNFIDIFHAAATLNLKKAKMKIKEERLMA